jgi:hypothetical protein
LAGFTGARGLELILGKKLFLTIQLLCQFGFDHRTLKSDIFDHPNLKTVHNWPSGGFERVVLTFFIYNLVLRT